MITNKLTLHYGASQSILTSNYPALEQVFSNLYLGSAEGALQATAVYTKEKTCAWPYGDYATEKEPISGIFGKVMVLYMQN